MPPQILKILKTLNLSDKETIVFLILLESSPMRASGIARSARLNRTTTYGVLGELIKRGLVSSIDKDGIMRYQSMAPEALPGYIERRREELADSKKEIEAVIPQIKLLRTRGKTLPRVRFFEGKEGVEQAYMETLENNKEKILLNIVGIESVYKKLDQTFVQHFLKRRLQLGIREKYVTPDSETARDYVRNSAGKLRNGKMISAEYVMDTEISIFDDKMGIFSFAQDNPVALIIEDETITKTIKTLFRYINNTAQLKGE